MPRIITEKGIYDGTWCPMLWKEPSGFAKRLKGDRSWDPFEEIHRGLSTGVSNKVALIRPHILGNKAVPYGDVFWLNIPSEEGKFMVAVKEVSLEPILGPDITLSLLRTSRYDPRDDDFIQAEKFLQILMFRFVRLHFPYVDVVSVKITYPTYQDIVTSGISEDDIQEAESWASDLYAQVNEDVTLLPNLERCPKCWWRDCPSREISDTPIKFTPGQKKIVSLD
jgi:hypothetical protein